MGAAVAAEKKVTRMLIVGETYRMQTKIHHGIGKTEGKMGKLDYQELTKLKYYSAKQLPNIAKVKVKKIMALNI